MGKLFTIHKDYLSKHYAQFYICWRNLRKMSQIHEGNKVILIFGSIILCLSVSILIDLQLENVARFQYQFE